MIKNGEMKLKKWISVVAVIVLAAGIIQPSSGYAKKRSIDQIDQELKQLQLQAKEAQAQQQQAEQSKQQAQHYVNKNNNYLKDVLAQIETVGNELSTISADLDQTEENLRKTAQKLDQTEQRIEKRSKLLDSRVRLMYTDGAVSYLDVLLSSTSFSDFLDRADSLESIANQDKTLLEEHKRDKQLVMDQKKALEKEYDKAKKLFAEAESRKQLLSAKEKEKQTLIAKYSNQMEESDDISEEQNQLLVQLASKRASLAQEKNKLRAAQIYTYQQNLKKKRAAVKRTSASSSPDSSGGSNEAYVSGNGSLSLPVGNARISSPYGYRIHPISGKKKLHSGIDFAVPEGTSVHAAEGGVVIVAEWWSGYGNCVIIDHGNNMWTLYGHLRDGGLKVSKGDTVKRGDVIAESGSTGQSTGPHLHFEVRLNGDPVDPSPYL